MVRTQKRYLMCFRPFLIFDEKMASHWLALDSTPPRLNFDIYVRCSCGRCNTSLLENPRECECCREVEGCAKALVDELVLYEAGNISWVTKSRI